MGLSRPWLNGWKVGASSRRIGPTLYFGNDQQTWPTTKMQRLTQIRIKGFKSIKQADIKLKDLNVLIGANGVGKSNFINAFKFLNALTEQKLQVHTAISGGADNILYRGRQFTDLLEFHLTFQAYGTVNNAYSCFLVPTNNNTFVFQYEAASLHNEEQYQYPYALSMGQGHLETKLPDSAKDEKIAKYVQKAMKSWQIYHFHDTSDTSRVKQPSNINDNAYLRSDSSNLAAYLYFLKEVHTEHYNMILSTIRLVAPFFDDFQLRQNPFNPEQINLEWNEKGTDIYYNAHSLSDGTLRFISLATLLLQPQDRLPTTILLDEPELGLHPYAIKLLASLLRSASEHTQVIISTQSVTLVNQFEPDDIIVVDRQDNQSVFRRVSDDEIESWLSDYSLGELWEKNIIGGRPAA
jgi:predicted ATPase